MLQVVDLMIERRSEHERSYTLSHLEACDLTSLSCYPAIAHPELPESMWCRYAAIALHDSDVDHDLLENVLQRLGNDNDFLDFGHFLDLG